MPDPRASGCSPAFAVLQRLGDLRLLDIGPFLQVGDGAGDTQHPVDRATTELQPLGGGLEQRLTGTIEGGIAPELRTGQRAVPWALWPPLPLASQRPHHSLAPHSARVSDDRGPQS